MTDNLEKQNLHRQEVGEVGWVNKILDFEVGVPYSLPCSRKTVKMYFCSGDYGKVLTNFVILPVWASDLHVFQFHMAYFVISIEGLPSSIS